MVIRIAADLDNLKRNLAEGRGQIEATTAGMQKFAASLDGSKLEQRAHNITAAIDSIGGATKLTDAEAARHLKTLDAWIEKGDRMGKEIPPDILKTRDALQQMTAVPASGFFSDLGNQIKATALGFISAQAVIGSVQTAFHTLTAFVGGSIESYASAEAAAKKMTVALQTQGTATPATIAHFNDLASSFQKTTVYSDDLINKMQALLTQVGDVAPSQMNKALTAATDLASGLGIDLSAATMLVSKASEENVGALKKAGVQLDATRVSGEGMSYILGEIEKRFGGQAQAEIDTYAGRVKQLANEWDNFKEAVGKSIVDDPLLQALLRNATTGVTGVSDAAGNSTATITEWWAAMQGGPVAQAALTILETAMADFEGVNRAAKNLPAAPKQFQEQADPFAGMMAGAKKFGDELVATWKKGDAAAKKHADQVEASFKKWSGAGATEQMGILDGTLQKLAKSGHLTKDQIEEIAKEAVKLQGEGAKLTERLYDAAKATDALYPSLKVTTLNVKEFGLEIGMAVPKLDAYQVAVNKLAAMAPTNVKDFAFNIGKPDGKDQKDAAKSMRDDWVKNLSQITAAFDQMAASSSGSLGRVMGSIGNVTNALAQAASVMTKGGPKGGDSHAGSGGILTPFFDKDASSSEKWSAGISAGMTVVSGAMSVWSATAQDATKKGAAFHGAMSGAQAGAAFGPYGMAVGAAAGAIAGLIHQMTIGRRTVEDFAKSFDTKALGSGFDELHAKMLTELGNKMGEDYWIKLTQGVKKNDKAGAQAVIDSIQEALAKAAANDPAKMAAAGGFKTLEELQVVADKAKKVYDYMLESGKYSASEIARAFQESADAQKAALGDTAKAQTEALAAISAKYADSISKLESEYKSLSDSVSKEAAEDVMGIVETQERARMEQIEAEKAAQIVMRDAEIAAKTESFAAVLTAGEAVDKALRETFGKTLDIPYRFYQQGGSPGGDYGYVPSGTPKSGGGGGGGTSGRSTSSGGGDQHITLVMPDGDVLLRQIVKSGKRKGWM